VKAKVNFLFLPAYSPDFNPIEEDRANMKRLYAIPPRFVIYFRPQFTVTGVKPY
jgi:transposase